MGKKDLKMYETPAMEIVETETEGYLMAGSAATNPFEDSTGDTEEFE